MPTNLDDLAERRKAWFRRLVAKALHTRRLRFGLSEPGRPEDRPPPAVRGLTSDFMVIDDVPADYR